MILVWLILHYNWCCSKDSKHKSQLIHESTQRGNNAYIVERKLRTTLIKTGIGWPPLLSILIPATFVVIALLIILPVVVKWLGLVLAVMRFLPLHKISWLLWLPGTCSLAHSSSCLTGRRCTWISGWQGHSWRWYCLTYRYRMSYRFVCCRKEGGMKTCWWGYWLVRWPTLSSCTLIVAHMALCS